MKKLTVMKIMIMSMVISMMMSSCKKIETAKLVENTETKQTNETEIKNSEEVITTTETESFEEIEIETEEEKIASPSEPNWPDENEWNTYKPAIMDFINNGYNVYLNIEDCKYEDLKINDILTESYLYNFISNNKDISINYFKKFYNITEQQYMYCYKDNPSAFYDDAFGRIPKNYLYSIDYIDESLMAISNLNLYYRNDYSREGKELTPMDYIASKYDEYLWSNWQDKEDKDAAERYLSAVKKAEFAENHPPILLEEGVDYWLSYEYDKENDNTVITIDKDRRPGGIAVDETRRYLTLNFNNRYGEGYLTGLIVERCKTINNNQVENLYDQIGRILSINGQPMWFSKGMNKFNLGIMGYRDLSLPNAYIPNTHRNANPEDFRVWFEGLTLNRY